MNLLHEWYKNHLNYEWVNAWDNTNQFNAEVNQPFNNAYAGDPLLFGTDNFARSSDVVYHECTHNVLYSMFGDYIGLANPYDECYAFDEGFADYFACSVTEDPRHGEGYGGTRTLDNNQLYPGKNAYNIEGHTGGTIIAGAAWDLRERFINRMGNAQGSQYADNLIFDALQQMSTLPRNYYFSDPQESNFLTSLYIADDDNNNLLDGIPHFHDIQAAFANHNLLQAVLFSDDSYDISTNSIGKLTYGDFYYSGGSFWANNIGQRGVIDLGNIGIVSLDQVNIPLTGYSRFGVAATVGHTYVSLAQQGEEGSYIVFRVASMNATGNETVIEYLYSTPLLIDPIDICHHHPGLCNLILTCKRYPLPCECQIVVPGRDLIRFKFRHGLDNIVIPIEKICLYVLNCPGCAPSGLYPGYDFHFDNMPEAFGIEVFNSKGQRIVSDVRNVRTKTVKFKARRQERYFLVITPGKETKIGAEYNLPLAVSRFEE
jgi:hypothetical protein